MKKPITNLEELEAEQEKLKMMMELTRQEFSRNLGTNRNQLKSFLLKNVVLPAGAVGLGVAAVNKVASSNNKKNHNNNSSNQGFSWAKLLPLAINLFQSLMLKKQSSELQELENNQKESTSSNLKSTSLKSVA